MHLYYTPHYALCTSVFSDKVFVDAIDDHQVNGVASGVVVAM